MYSFRSTLKKVFYNESNPVQSSALH